jgi:hypothetical protein
LKSLVKLQSLSRYILVSLIVCEAVDELPYESVAVQVLVTEYEPAHEPIVVTSAVNESRTTASVAVVTANTAGAIDS